MNARELNRLHTLLNKTEALQNDTRDKDAAEYLAEAKTALLRALRAGEQRGRLGEKP